MVCIVFSPNSTYQITIVRFSNQVKIFLPKYHRNVWFFLKIMHMSAVTQFSQNQKKLEKTYPLIMQAFCHLDTQRKFLGQIFQFLVPSLRDILPFS